MGLDRDTVMIINNVSELGNDKTAFKEKLLQHSEALSGSFNKRTPADLSIWVYTFGSQQMEESIGFQSFIGDDEYVPTMGFRLLKGRNFSNEIASDSMAIILTESAVKELDLEEPVLGTHLKESYNVIGVVADFSFKSFNEQPGPAVILYDPDGYRLSIRTKGNSLSDFKQYVEKTWKSFTPGVAIQYTFLDSTFENLIEKEKSMGKMINLFTFLAIFISCLGLLGLGVYSTKQRTKEIGIRKVLGASVRNIMFLLNLQYTKLVFFAIIVSVPIAWFIINIWLQNFAYKVEINLLVFLLSGIAALSIAWFTVATLTYGAANANPVNSLRNE